MPSKVIKFIDLFAGLGGIRLGFEQALAEYNLKGQCVFTSEIKPTAIKAYNANFTDKHIEATDITKIKKDDIGPFNVLLGGFPCQAFSYAGKQKGFADTRGTLFFDVQRILRDHLSTVDGFILENVEGLVNHDRENIDDKEGRTIKTIMSILIDDLKFNAEYVVLNAADYGMPQKRKRVYIVGCKKKYGEINLKFEPQPIVGTNVALEQGLPPLENDFTHLLLNHFSCHDLKGKTIKDKRGGDQNIHSWDIMLKGFVSSEERDLLNKLVCERRQHKWAKIIGIDWMDGMPLTEKQISTFYQHPKLHEMLEYLVSQHYLVYEYPKKKIWHVDERGNRWSTREPDTTKPKGYNIITGKLSFEFSSILDPNKPTNTIVAMDMGTIGVVDGYGLRHLTLREGLRLFGYPETYSLDFYNNEKGGIEKGYDLLGNSVCVPVIKMIAERLIQTIYI